MQELHNTSLLSHNTFGIDVKADTVITYHTPEQLSALISQRGNTLPKPLLHIGQGSNLLFMNDFGGTILLNDNKDVSVLQHGEGFILVQVGAGYVMDEFISHAISQGWYGLENLSLIPGQVGASAVQNIGAYGVEAGDLIHSVNCVSLVDGTSRSFSHDQCSFAYRHSVFKSPEYRGRYAVVSVVYKLSPTFRPNLEYGGVRKSLESQGIDPETVTPDQLRQTIISIRQAKLPDPKEQGNAGSFFMNPVVSAAYFHDNILSSYPNAPHYVVDEDNVKVPAAWLIEQCGWKGQSLGRAAVHGIQPLVLVNTGGAEGSEIKQLSDRIQSDVLAKFGISIHPEVNFIY